MQFDESEVRSIIERARRRVGDAAAETEGRTHGEEATAARIAEPSRLRLGDGIFHSIEEATEAAARAFAEYRNMGLKQRTAITDRIRALMREHAWTLAQMAHEETGLGRTEDKALKNLLVINKTPGPEDLEPQIRTGDRGMMLIEYAPFGVVASITPTTNPTATIINNTIGILSAGNSVVFNVHPNAKQVSVENVRLINRAVSEAGGPANLVTTITEPTIESARGLMNHPRVRLLIVTGGPGVVQEALKTKKRAITAGPGNPPVVVDETADLGLAAQEVIRGASFDNNVICTDEKEVFVVDGVADEFLRAMERFGAVRLKEYQLRQLERVIFKELGQPGRPGVIDSRWIGQNAGRILNQIGVSAGDEVRLVVCEVPAEHSLVWTEQMMPVMPVVRARNVDQAIDLAVKAEHGFGHTASIFSRNVETITRLARGINVSIFVANAANLAGLAEGGEGFTSFSIASPTGEGLTRPRSFSRERRITVVGAMRIV